MPINCLFNGNSKGLDITNFSPKIVPVFWGFGIRNDFLSDIDVQYLKKYETIGCRDEFTQKVLRRYGIEA